MVDYFEIAKYPLLDKKNFLIGFIVGTLSFLILPLFLIFGYLSKTIRETLKNSDELPSWNKAEYWKDYFIHGFFIFLIIVLYLLPAFLMSSVSLVLTEGDTSTFLETETPWEEVALLGGGISPIAISLLFFSSILFFAALFLLPMAIVMYSASENIRYAFKLDEIFPKIKSMIIPYAKAFLASLFVFFLAFLLLLIPGVGFFMGGILLYPLLFSGRLFAEVFRNFDY